MTESRAKKVFLRQSYCPCSYIIPFSKPPLSNRSYLADGWCTLPSCLPYKSCTLVTLTIAEKDYDDFNECKDEYNDDGTLKPLNVMIQNFKKRKSNEPSLYLSDVWTHNFTRGSYLNSSQTKSLKWRLDRGIPWQSSWILHSKWN